MSKKYKNLKTGVIGVGSMGQNHARVYNEISNLVAVSDLNFEHGKEISERFDTNFFEDYRDMFPEVDAISVAVPTSLHLDVACSALQAGVHVLVEKPLAASIEESKNIIRTAKKFERVLSVGHIERHNPVVQYLKNSLVKENYGRPITFSTRRVSSLPTRIRDVGVVYDLAIHDIDVLRYLSGSEAQTVYATGGHANNIDYEDHSSILIEFANGITGFIEVNWLTPMKVRQLEITSMNYFIRSDYSDQSVEILSSEYLNLDNSNLYSANLDVKKEIISVEREEPLKNELLDFLSSIVNDHEPKVTGGDGLSAMVIANSVLESIKSGKKIDLSSS